MDGKVELEIIQQEGVAVVIFKTPSINDVQGIADAVKKIKKWIAENHPARIVFDFKYVKFFSSLVLGLLLDVRSELQQYNGQVAISAINPQLHRVFKITNLDKIFVFFPDRQDAVKAMSTDLHVSD